MKLKSVELIGFKSFARKTKINFHPGITEIVGPNGSGKSNIIEAIRWALGEQSAKNLRSSRMTDVIFSGSQSNPALNRAKVTLDFDNRDHYIHTNYDDLSISRTVYRDGTNNYYINNEPCRLRDVQDLFMNTGIGNGSFSIISQGKVSQIFKSKPENRRFIIETVAGIYKYRSQKEVASKKLARVNNNLDRLQDINYELENQLHSLAKARLNAIKYIKLKRRANCLDINRLLVRAHHLKQRRIHNSTGYQKIAKQLIDNHEQIKRIKELQLKLQEQVNKNSRASDQIQDKILRTSHRLDTLSNQQNLNQQKIHFWGKQIKQNKDRITVANRKVDKLNSRMFKLTSVKTRDLHRVKALKEEIKKARHPVVTDSVKIHQAKINKLRTDYLSLVKKSVTVKGQINNLRQSNHDQTVRLNRAKQQIARVNKVNNHLIRQIKLLSHFLSHVDHQINLDTKNLNQQKIYYNRLIKGLKSTRRNYEIQSRRKQTLLIRVNGLKRMAQSHSNLNYGSRNLLNHAKQFPGILGPVAKFIKVSDKYIQAIETTLRSQLQQIIVNNSETARQAVRFMSQRRLGRVTLLPMNEITRRWVDRRSLQRCSHCPGFIGVAADLVQMPERFSAVKFHLLGNVLVATDVTSAITVSHMIHRRYRVVTLDGNVVNAGGAITGGHGRYHYHGILSQKAKLEHYQVALTKLNQNYQKNFTKVSALRKQLSQIQQDIDSSKSNLNQNRQKFAIKDSLRKRLINEVHNYHKLMDDHHYLAQTSSGNNQRNLPRLLKLQTSVKKQITDNHHELKALQNQVSRETATHNQIARHYQQLREALIKAESQRSQNLLKNSSLSTKIKQATQAVDHYNQINLHLKKLIDQQRTNYGHDRHLKRVQTKLDHLKKQKLIDQHESIKNQKRLTKTDHQLSNAQDQLIKVRDQLNQNRLRTHDVHRKQNEVKEVLLRRYQVNLQAQTLPIPKSSLYQISSKLLEIQKQLREIGSVDVNSINRFKKVNHRYRFLSKQVNDLVTSKHQLITTMNQMNSKIISKFKSTFDQVNRAFKITYSQIFRGGKAKLALVDPHHLLTTGINIMAQPPGKRYRNMELLSGGERALTAIVLLFAILKVKPAPFCILDEAESALDAINIDRFGDYMQKLKLKTQFIVITHRKTTMLYADNLYGVTMQNSGVSKIISVNLHKAKAEG